MNKLNSFDSNLDIKFCSYELRIYHKDIGTVQDINYPLHCRISKYHYHEYAQ